MKLETGKCYRTSNGNRVRVTSTDVLNPKYPVLGLVLTRNSHEERVELPVLYTAEGSYFANGCTPHRNDLISPWTDLREGQLVFCGGSADKLTHIRKFDKLTDVGLFRVFNGYGTAEIWDYCRAITPEDLICPP